MGFSAVLVLFACSSETPSNTKSDTKNATASDAKKTTPPAAPKAGESTATSTPNDDNSSTDACEDACSKANPKAEAVQTAALRTCVCTATACQTACGSSFCGATPTEPGEDENDPCNKCLEEHSDACDDQVEKACAASADCAPITACYDKCGGDDAEESDADGGAN